ncbi:MAG: response regulator [Brumimicrobium sp.]
MKIKVLIVEDEVLVAEDIAGDLKNDGFEVSSIAISSEEALENIEKTPPHIILMDINIKGKLDGIETAEIINSNYNIPIIYVTSNTSSQFVSRALKTSPHAFISKPYRHQDLTIAIELAIERHNQYILEMQENEVDLHSIFVKGGDYYRKVMLKDVLYIEASGSYCKVVTKNGNYTLSFNLHRFESQISYKILKRVHRSYIVNLENVEGIDKSSLIINGKTIPVSNAYKEEVFGFFQKV